MSPALLSALALLAAALPSPSPSPAGERERLWPILQWPQECEDQHRAVVAELDEPDARLRTFELEAGLKLIEVGCDRGAYQGTARHFLLDESVTPPVGQRLLLPAFEQDDHEIWQPKDWDEVLGEADFDAKRKTLTVFGRARGIGDCGQRGTWRFDAKTRRLVLVEFRARECDDEPDKAGAPETWPRIFPAATAPTAKPTPSAKPTARPTPKPSAKPRPKPTARAPKPTRKPR